MIAKNYTPIDDLVHRHKRELAKIKAQKGRPKEAEPFVIKKEKYEIKEVVERKVDTEIRDYIETKPDSLELPEELKKLGLHAATATDFPDYQNLKLPLSDEKIIAGLHQPITSSVRWFATLLEYLLKQAHLVLKVVNGKVVRVIKT